MQHVVSVESSSLAIMLNTLSFLNKEIIIIIIIITASSLYWDVIYVLTVMIHWRVRGFSCEPNNQLNILYHFKKGWGWRRETSLSPPVIHYRPFQGGIFVVVLCYLFLESEFRWRFTLSMLILFLVRFRLLSGHLLGNSCSLCWTYVIFVFWIFIILVISRFGFEEWSWVLIALVPDLCIRLLKLVLYYKQGQIISLRERNNLPLTINHLS